MALSNLHLTRLVLDSFLYRAASEQQLFQTTFFTFRHRQAQTALEECADEIR